MPGYYNQYYIQEHNDKYKKQEYKYTLAELPQSVQQAIDEVLKKLDTASQRQQLKQTDTIATFDFSNINIHHCVKFTYNSGENAEKHNESVRNSIEELQRLNKFASTSLDGVTIKRLNLSKCPFSNSAIPGVIIPKNLSEYILFGEQKTIITELNLSGTAALNLHCDSMLHHLKPLQTNQALSQWPALFESLDAKKVQKLNLSNNSLGMITMAVEDFYDEDGQPTQEQLVYYTTDYDDKGREVFSEEIASVEQLKAQVRQKISTEFCNFIQSTTVLSLDLSSNSLDKLSPEELVQFFNALTNNTKIQELDLSNNNIMKSIKKPSVLQAFYEFTQQNKTLKRLVLSNDDFAYVEKLPKEQRTCFHKLMLQANQVFLKKSVPSSLSSSNGWNNSIAINPCSLYGKAKDDNGVSSTPNVNTRTINYY